MPIVNVHTKPPCPVTLIVFVPVMFPEAQAAAGVIATPLYVNTKIELATNPDPVMVAVSDVP